MLTRIDLRGVADVSSRLPRPHMDSQLPLAEVRAILADVRERGDTAVRELTARLDGVQLADLRVPPGQLSAALAELPAALRGALEAARDAIFDYHCHQLRRPRRTGAAASGSTRSANRSTAPGSTPGGRARYPSSVLMTAVPARVAGVAELALCVPPDTDGSVDPATLAAAALAGVEEVYPIGGAQAIAALAYGTETITPVEVIAGPGNVFVSLAKREVAGVVGVPSAFAGPSEVVVVVDDTTRADLAAIDLVVQAEHGPDGLAWLISWSEPATDAVVGEVSRLVAAAPRRKEVESTLASGGYAVLVDGPEQAMAVSNLVAPEHLEIMSADPAALVPLVRSAGAVFTGSYSPASVGDYLAGPSHVLPTHRSARFASALGVDDFVKAIHVICLDEGELRRVGPHVVAIAEAEGLSAHADSIRMRWA